jgi:ketosteroid isomerase-like protein
MKSVRLIALVLVTLSLLVVPLAWGQGGNPPASTKESGATSGHGMTAAEQTGKSSGGNAEQQIKTLQEQGRQAALKGDATFVEKYFADDYVGVGGNGQMRTKAEVIQMYKSGALKYEAIDERNVKIRTYGDTAIVNTEATVKATLNGKTISGDFRGIFVWVKSKGGWKEVAFQTTPIAPAGK